MQLFSSTGGRTWSGLSTLDAPVRWKGVTPTFGQFLSLALCLMAVLNVWSHAATVAWDAVAGATGYRVYRSQGVGPFQMAVQTPATQTTAQVSFDATERTRVYATTLQGTAESGPSNVVTNTPVVQPPEPPTVPGAPEIIYVNRITGSRIDLGWATKDLTSVSQVWRSQDSQAWTMMITLGPGSLHWSDGNAQKRKTHSYRIVSCTQFGCSPASAAVTYPGKGTE